MTQETTFSFNDLLSGVIADLPPVVASHSAPPSLDPHNAQLHTRISFMGAFVSALAAHRNLTFDEADMLLGGVSQNLWNLVESPTGWTALGLLLSPPSAEHQPLLTPAIH